MIDLTGDSVTPQTLFEGATAHDKSGAPISGAVAVAPPSTMTPSMDGTASTGTETAYARGDHVHPTDTSRAAVDNVVTLDSAQDIEGQKTFLMPIITALRVSRASANSFIEFYNEDFDEVGEIGFLRGDPNYLMLRGGQNAIALDTLAQIITVSGAKITSLGSPTDASDATNKKYVDARTPDVQTQGNWRYKVYADGTFEAWYKATGQSITITAQSGNLYRSDAQTITLPTAMTSGKTCNIQHVSVNAAHNNYPAWGMLASIQTPTANTFKYYAMSGGSRTASPNYTVTAYVFGTLE